MDKYMYFLGIVFVLIAFGSIIICMHFIYFQGVLLLSNLLNVWLKTLDKMLQTAAHKDIHVRYMSKIVKDAHQTKNWLRPLFNHLYNVPINTVSTEHVFARQDAHPVKFSTIPC